MQRLTRLPLCLILLAPLVAHAQDAGPTLVKFLDGPRTVVGELVRDTDETLTIRELDTGKEKSFDKSKLKLFEKGIADKEAIATAGLSDFMAWKLSKVLPAGRPEGRIIKSDSGIIFINLGKASVKPDQELTVYRGTDELKDPVTGAVLGKERRKIARLVVTEVQELFCKAKLKGDLEIKLAVGDEVEPTNASNAVAIFPMVDTAGNVTVGGRKLSEELTTKLVAKNVPVVERALLADAVLELALQKTYLFDAKETQKVGKQVGAFAVLTGTIVPAGKFVEAHIRLIEVDSARVLLTASGRLHDSGNTSPLAIEPGTGTPSKPGKLNNLMQALLKLCENGKTFKITYGGGSTYVGLKFTRDGKWTGRDLKSGPIGGTWSVEDDVTVVMNGGGGVSVVTRTGDTNIARYSSVRGGREQNRGILVEE